jgi:DNA-binding GntR family transcriptional regulator
VNTAGIRRLDRARGGTRGQVYSALLEAITAAELEPGRRLSENELADSLGVSRTPVREALIRLADERLVEIVPQLGTFVTRISARALEEAQFVREALECAAVRLAAERAERADVAALGALLARQRELRDAGSFDAFYVLDDELHAALCEIAGRPVAWRLSQRANGQLNRVRRLSLPQPRYLAEMVGEHELIVDAVRRGDADAAEAAMRHHLRMVLGALPAIRAEHPDYFATEA